MNLYKIDDNGLNTVQSRDSRTELKLNSFGETIIKIEA